MNGQRLRPLGLGDIFDEGFDLYKRNFVFLLLITALTVVPLDLGLAFAAPRLLTAVYDLVGITARSDGSWVWLVTFLTQLTLFSPLYLLAVTPVVSASAGRYMEVGLTLWQVYRAWLRRLPGLMLSLLLVGTALDAGWCFCLVGWFVPATQLFLTLHVFMIEGKGPGKALVRSGTLAGGYGGRVFGCLLLLGLIAWVISLGVTLPLSYLADSALNIAPGAHVFLGGTNGTAQSAQQQIVAWISHGLAHLFLIPFLVCVATVMYYDVRIRKEGFDIELLAAGLNYPPLTALAPHLPPVPAPMPIRMPLPARPVPQKGPPR